MGYQIELRHLKYFLAVSNELNFRKAADILCISQPGLSRQIKQMEDILGMQLFVRTKRSVKLTEAGIYLKGEAEYVINHLDKTFNQMKLLNEGKAGVVTIGFLGSAMQNVIPDLLVKMNVNFPGIKTNLEEMSNMGQLRMIQDDALDLGFVRLSGVPDGLIMKRVFTDSFSVVLPKNHELNEGNFAELNQLRDDNFILFSRDYSPYYFDKITTICHEAGFSPKISHNSVHALTIFRLVENNLGVAIVPTSLKKGFNLDVKFLEIPNLKEEAILSAVWKEGNRNPALGKILPLL